MSNSSSSGSTLYTNAVVFTADAVPSAEALLVTDDRLAFVGDVETARRMAGESGSVNVVDLGGDFVMPGFTDGHTHLVMTGEALQKVDLLDAGDLAGIQERLREASVASPEAPRVLGRSWLPNAVPGEPTRQMLDEVDADRPIYLDANDIHSVWVNSAALRELGITRDTPDPVGGRIARDADGEPSGMLYETAVLTHVWPKLTALASDADRDAALDATFEHYLASGVTGAIEMALSEEALAALLRAEARHGSLPVRVAAHWLINRDASPEQIMEQVGRAIELSSSVSSPWLSVVGVKLILDGVIDSCTAAMKEPYADGSNAEPIWGLDELIPVVVAADAAGLQIAMHAIGDDASGIALDALEHAFRVNGARVRRHRMEHLETITVENVARLAALGVVASMQPVHADPAVQENWRAMLGDDRVDRGFPWPELVAAGAPLVFGTDAPTAPYPPLPNMFIAATRRSAFDQSLPANLPVYAMPIADALGHATRVAAWSCGRESDLGSLSTGKLADFIVLDTNPLTAAPEELLTARVKRTVVGGETRFIAS
ncbi:MAG: amidohydrolase [Homoserinimonas sp.]